MSSSSGSAFDDLLSEITGTGWYQKRLVYFLLAPIFFVVPFTFLHQIFVYNQNGKKQLQMYYLFYDLHQIILDIFFWL